jgi:hypothetical protein
MPFPSITLASGTVADTTLVNAALNAGITNPAGGLSLQDFTAGVVGNLLIDAAPNQGTGQAKNAKFTLNTTSGATTALAGELTGAAVVVAEYTAIGAAALTVRTAALMIADAGLVAGSSYFLAIVNLGTAGTVTLTTATGVTLTGTMTIANNTWRGFIVTVPTATTMTFQSVMIGTIG